MGVQGVVRFLRSISVGLTISLDYWWAGRGLDEVRTGRTGLSDDCEKVLFVAQDSAEYDQAVAPCHQRSADRIVAGALKNGGLYIKLGQGLGTFNQILPRQYIDTLKTLQDKVYSLDNDYISLYHTPFVQALAREFKEVSPMVRHAEHYSSPAPLTS